MTQPLRSRRGALTRRLPASALPALAVAEGLAGCAETQLGAQFAKSFARAGTATESETGSGSGSAAETGAEPGAASRAAPTAMASTAMAGTAAGTAAADPRLAPEIFDATGLTIWDGAATLQGVWFAHPLAQRAQRVKVYNAENGLEVEGALFRRDPAISGPSILLSSDAARALGVTPGDPTELRIVALREGPLAPETAIAAAPLDAGPADAGLADAGPADADPTDGAPLATAAAAATAAATGPDLAPAPSTPASRVETAALAAPGALADGESDDGPADGPAGAMAAGAETTASGAETGDEAAPDDPGDGAGTIEVATEEEPVYREAPAAQSGSGEPVLAETRRLPAIEYASTETPDEAPGRVRAPIARPERPVPVAAPAAYAPPTDAPAVDAPVVDEPDSDEPEVAAAAPRDAAAIAPAAGRLSPGRYLQIGTFGVEENARTLVRRLRSRGQPAEYVVRDVGGSPFSIVVVGPLADAAAVDAARAAAAAEGQSQPLEMNL